VHAGKNAVLAEFETARDHLRAALGQTVGHRQRIAHRFAAGART
jgi:hypothetical protein